MSPLLSSRYICVNWLVATCDDNERISEFEVHILKTCTHIRKTQYNLQCKCIHIYAYIMKNSF